MFVLPKDITKKVILGKLDYNKLPYNEENEVLKGFFLEDQAKVNLELGRQGHKPVCTALDEICMKEGCRLYSIMGGKIKNSWSCKEYKADYPDTKFDSRHHITFIGNESIDLEKTVKNIEELARKGAGYFCKGCGQAYEKAPQRFVSECFGSGGYIDACSCGRMELFPPKLFAMTLKAVSWINAVEEKYYGKNAKPAV